MKLFVATELGNRIVEIFGVEHSSIEQTDIASVELVDGTVLVKTKQYTWN